MKRWRLGAFAIAIAGLCITFASPAVASGGGFFPYTNPTTPAVPSYTGNTCEIDFSSIPDYTFVNSVTGCGVTVKFSSPMMRLTVGSTYTPTTWGDAPDVEAGNPAVLFSGLQTDSVTLTYTSATRPSLLGRRTLGVEVAPDAYDYAVTFSATFAAANGTTDGTIRQTTTLDSSTQDAHAKLIAARTKTIPKVTSLTISENDVLQDGFLIARIRV